MGECSLSLPSWNKDFIISIINKQNIHLMQQVLYA